MINSPQKWKQYKLKRFPNNIFISFMKTSKLKIALIFIICIHYFPSFGQKNSTNLLLNVHKKDSIANYFEMDISISNDDSTSILFFKPDVNYVNYGLINIVLFNQMTKKSYNLNYGERGDLDSVTLTLNNSITLNKGEMFTKNILININNFSPHLPHGEYLLELKLNYSITNFKTDYKGNVFKGELIASPILIKII